MVQFPIRWKHWTWYSWHGWKSEFDKHKRTLQPFSFTKSCYDRLFILTIFMLNALILYVNGGTYSLKSSFVRNLLIGSRRWNVFIFSLWCPQVRYQLNSGLTSNKPTYYLLDYSDFLVENYPQFLEHLFGHIVYGIQGHVSHNSSPWRQLYGYPYWNTNRNNVKVCPIIIYCPK